MKKIITLILLISIIIPATHSQSIMTRDNSVKEKSCKKEIEELKKKMDEQTNSFTKRVETLQKMIKQLQEKNTELKKKFKPISSKDNSSEELEKLKTENKKLKEKERNLKKEILQQITADYSSNSSFDNLVKTSSIHSIKRDKNFYQKQQIEIPEIMNDLEQYFIAEELLLKKANRDELDKAKSTLENIRNKYSDSEYLKNNEKRIDRYIIYNEALKDIINDIKDLDNRAEGEVKRRDLFNIIYGNEDIKVMYKDYPYLREIINDLIDRKDRNIDTDISDLSKKL